MYRSTLIHVERNTWYRREWRDFLLSTNSNRFWKAPSIVLPWSCSKIRDSRYRPSLTFIRGGLNCFLLFQFPLGCFVCLFLGGGFALLAFENCTAKKSPVFAVFIAVALLAEWNSGKISLEVTHFLCMKLNNTTFTFVYKSVEYSIFVTFFLLIQELWHHHDKDLNNHDARFFHGIWNVSRFSTHMHDRECRNMDICDSSIYKKYPQVPCYHTLT